MPAGERAHNQAIRLVEQYNLLRGGGSANLFSIVPCTANTISKIACGIDDTPVTTFATTALGSKKPLIFVLRCTTVCIGIRQ